MKRSLKLFSLVAVTFCFIFVSCKKDHDYEKFPDRHDDHPSGFAENSMVMFWNDKISTVLSTPMNLPTRSRYFAILSIAVYDALNNIKPKYQRYALREMQRNADPNAAVASAAYWAIKGLNLQASFPVDNWYDSSISVIPDSESKQIGISLGKKAAEAIIALRANDGFTQVIISSTNPPDGDEPGEYRSTLMLVGGVLTTTNLKRIPNWGTVMLPYVLSSNMQFRPGGPYAINSTEYSKDLKEVKEKGGRDNNTRTDEESKIMKFWSENRSSLTWNTFSRLAILNKKLDAWKTARLFALIHVSNAETINTVLNSMYHFYFWRPETAIRLAETDGNDNTEADANWLPFLNEVPNTFPSPPQPGYPSSFASFGGAVTEILRSVMETDFTSIEFKSASLTGERRFFSSFSQAASENSMAMVYAGWEFRKSAIDGEETGKKIARFIFRNHFKEE